MRFFELDFSFLLTYVDGVVAVRDQELLAENRLITVTRRTVRTVLSSS